MPVNSRQKGSRVEREASAYLRKLGFAGARRSQQFKGDAGSFDITCEAIPNVCLEVKSREDIKLGSVVLDNALIKAAADADGKPWAVLWKRNRIAWRLTFETAMPWVNATVCGDEDITDALMWLNGDFEHKPIVVVDDKEVPF